MSLWAENARTAGEEWGWGGEQPRAGRKVGEGRGRGVLGSVVLQEGNHY